MVPFMETRGRQDGLRRRDLVDESPSRVLAAIPSATRENSAKDEDAASLERRGRRRHRGRHHGRHHGKHRGGPRGTPAFGGDGPLGNIIDGIAGSIGPGNVGSRDPGEKKKNEEDGEESGDDDSGDSDSDDDNDDEPNPPIEKPKGPPSSLPENPGLLNPGADNPDNLLPPPPPPPPPSTPPSAPIVNPDPITSEPPADSLPPPGTIADPSNEPSDTPSQTQPKQGPFTTLVPGATNTNIINNNDGLFNTDQTSLLYQTKTASFSAPVNTPLITLPSTGIQNGVGTGSTRTSQLGSAVKATATSGSGSKETADADVSADPGNSHHGLHGGSEKALIAVGALGFIAIIALVFWLFRRRRKSKKTRPTTMEIEGWRKHLPSSPTFGKPRRRLTAAIGRFSIAKSRRREDGWQDLSSPSEKSFVEKDAPDLPAYTPRSDGEAPGIVVHTTFTRKSNYDGNGLELNDQHPNQAVPTADGQFNLGIPQNTQYINIRASYVSSLSSGFGDMDMIVPPPPAAVSQSQLRQSSVPSTVGDDESRKRDTISTEASEDFAPRFRTVNSWVRQQSTRVKRERMRELTAGDAPPVPQLPPEQEFNLMMPDGEVPRRPESSRVG